MNLAENRAKLPKKWGKETIEVAFCEKMDYNGNKIHESYFQGGCKWNLRSCTQQRMWRKLPV